MTTTNEEWRIRTEELSGYAYISARVRLEEYPRRSRSGRLVRYDKLPVTTPVKCNHVDHICPTRECVESWGLGDWQLFLNRTEAGRRFISQLSLLNEDLELLEQEDLPREKRLPSAREPWAGEFY